LAGLFSLRSGCEEICVGSSHFAVGAKRFVFRHRSLGAAADSFGSSYTGKLAESRASLAVETLGAGVGETADEGLALARVRALRGDLAEQTFVGSQARVDRAFCPLTAASSAAQRRAAVWRHESGSPTGTGRTRAVANSFAGVRIGRCSAGKTTVHARIA
jgi:hypothetical protein